MSERVSGIPVSRKKLKSENSCNNGSETLPNQVLPSTPVDGKQMRTPVKEKGFIKSEKTLSDSFQTGQIGNYTDTNKRSFDAENSDKLPKLPTLVSNSKDWLLYYILLVVMTATSFFTRFYKIELPTHVCWDETHFGKMGSWYIKRSFFFDVHPPLGKMLIGLSGYLTGYDGEFPFSKPGDEYEDTQYVGMRMFCALLGSLLVPLVYMSTWQLSHSVTAALLASSFVLFDMGTLTLSRYILLDPILMFFIMTATYSLLKFLSYKNSPYCFSWWFWMSVTGVFLACSIGVKFVGLFVVLLAGYSTAADLWSLLGNQKLSLMSVLKHLIARVLCLIVVPVLCYCLIFAIHFAVLSKSGNGDGFYSSQFQSQLEGNRLYNVSMPENIAYGSKFSLKQRRTGGAYLHSHWHLYPEDSGPRQQQITTYSHKDDNNYWIVKPATSDIDDTEHPELVKSGDLVRLEHMTTKRNLHSHKEPAPVTKRHYQVSGYGQDGKGDANDVWIIEVVGAPLGTPVQSVRSKLKITHYHVRCVLHSHDKKLPKWGFEQLEVTCNPNTKDSKDVWSLEEVIDPRLPNVSFEVYSPTFLEKIMESHAVMAQGNSGLKPKEGEVTSRPWQWPINMKGQIFSGKDHRIYLLGNPVIFWGVFATIGLFFLVYGVYAFRRQRGVKLMPHLAEFYERSLGACWWLFLAWALHYLPFWPMTRVLYFHHYFPAFLYNAMLAGVIIDHVICRLCCGLPELLSNTLYHWCIGLVLSGVAYSFYLFHPLTYGMSGPMANSEDGMMHGLNWMESWEI